jgi:hypothetical protein
VCDKGLALGLLKHFSPAPPFMGQRSAHTKAQVYYPTISDPRLWDSHFPGRGLKARGAGGHGRETRPYSRNPLKAAAQLRGAVASGKKGSD